MDYFFKTIAPLMKTYAGREKMCRIIQYFLMFLLPLHNKNVNSKLSIIAFNAGQTRKVLRFGLEFPIITGILKRHKQSSQSKSCIKYVQSLGDLCDLSYVILDHPQFLVNIGFIKSWNKEFIAKLEYTTEFFWLMATVCEIIFKIK